MTHTHILPEWNRLVVEIKNSGGLVFILGATHSGKTTLAKFLAEVLCREGEKVALLDGDIGQSIFGPPTTLSLAFLPNPTDNLSSIPPAFRYFIGSNTPSGHFLPLIVGLKKLVDKAFQAGYNITIIDTTGFVSGGAAVELKRRKLELLQPRHIVALQKNREVEDILQGLPTSSAAIVHRLPVSPKARIKSPEERQAYRQKKYAEYFHDLKEYEFGLKKVKLWGRYYSPESSLANLGAIPGLLLGLNDSENLTLAIGILQELDMKEGKIRVLAPYTNLKDVQILHFGVIRINPLGKDQPVGSGPQP
jgi:polynucleotide 5'-hydroxyl-kinase GRC3/NOL9